MGTNKNMDELNNAYANLVLMIHPMIEVIESLQGTNMYRHGLKKSLNNVLLELEKKDLGERLSALWEVDKDAVFHIVDRYKDLCRRLSICDPETWGCADEVIRILIQNKEWVLHRLNIQSGESTEIGNMERRENLIGRINSLPIKSLSQIENLVSGLENIYTV